MDPMDADTDEQMDRASPAPTSSASSAFSMDMRDEDVAAKLLLISVRPPTPTHNEYPKESPKRSGSSPASGNSLRRPSGPYSKRKKGKHDRRRSKSDPVDMMSVDEEDASPNIQVSPSHRRNRSISSPAAPWEKPSVPSSPTSVPQPPSSSSSSAYPGPSSASSHPTQDATMYQQQALPLPQQQQQQQGKPGHFRRRSTSEPVQSPFTGGLPGPYPSAHAMPYALPQAQSGNVYPLATTPLQAQLAQVQARAAAVAGYHLGAQTAMAMLMQQLQQPPPQASAFSTAPSGPSASSPSVDTEMDFDADSSVISAHSASPSSASSHTPTSTTRQRRSSTFPSVQPLGTTSNPMLAQQLYFQQQQQQHQHQQPQHAQQGNPFDMSTMMMASRYGSGPMAGTAVPSGGPSSSSASSTGSVHIPVGVNPTAAQGLAGNQGTAAIQAMQVLQAAQAMMGSVGSVGSPPPFGAPTQPWGQAQPQHVQSTSTGTFAGPNKAKFGGRRKAQCRVCGNLFAQTSNLTAHMRIHNGDRPFACEFPGCTKRFAQKANLKRHYNTHTGTKQFVCPQCNKGFSRKENLASHMRTHTGEKPFKCKECGRSFGTRGTLKTHTRVHTGEKPYLCTVAGCGKRFARKAELNKHQRSSHANGS